MKLKSSYQHPDGLFFLIEKEPAGYLLFVYEVEKFFQEDVATDNGCPNHQDDYLQLSLQAAQTFAFKKFSVPTDSWVEVTGN